MKDAYILHLLNEGDMDARGTFMEGFSGPLTSPPTKNKMLEELLAEPIVQMLMARDGVHPNDVRLLSEKLRRRPPYPIETRAAPAEPTPPEPARPEPIASQVECLDLTVVTETKRLLEEAAALQCRPVHEFVLGSAVTAARMLVRRSRTYVEPCAFREPNPMSVEFQH